MKLTRRELRDLVNETFEISFKQGTTQKQKQSMMDQLGNMILTGHSRFETQFINELGNHIQIAIQDFGCGSAGQLTISIVGPNSETENTITRMEAIELHRLLGDYLRSDRQ